MIECEIHKKLISDAFNRYKNQDKVIGREIFDKVNEFLINSIELYQAIYFLDENAPKCKEICSCFGYDKGVVLRYLKENYSDQLSLLKNLGGDISDYPCNLEELIK